MPLEWKEAFWELFGPLGAFWSLLELLGLPGGSSFNFQNTLQNKTETLLSSPKNMSESQRQRDRERERERERVRGRSGSGRERERETETGTGTEGQRDRGTETQTERDLAHLVKRSLPDTHECEDHLPRTT